MTSLEDANCYVGTSDDSAVSQFELLRSLHLQSSDSVLEIGCGTLRLGERLMRFLEPGKYAGLDPNEWLREAAFADRPGCEDLAITSRASFLSCSDFDASLLCKKFHVIFSHSVLSHAAQWQLEQFMRNTAKCLEHKGMIIASFRLGGVDSQFEEWQYPGCSYFTWDTIARTAMRLNLGPILRPDLKDMHVAKCSGEMHDWMLLLKTGHHS